MRSNSEHATFLAPTQICSTELLLSLDLYWTFTVYLDQAVGWYAGKADKEGVQAGEAGLQQRCSQLEMALLQGLQQVCKLCTSAQAYSSQLT